MDDIAYSAFDPRSEIRETICTKRFKQGTGYYYPIAVTDDRRKTIYVPMYFEEEVKDTTLEEMPYVSMEIVSTTYTPQDIGAPDRKMVSYIDLHLIFADTDNIEVNNFAKKVKDWLHDKVRTQQINCTFPTIDFINIESDRYERELNGHQVIYHYIMTVYVLYYDYC